MNTELDAAKTTSKKVVDKAGEFLGSKIAEAVTKSNDNKIVKPGEDLRNVEQIIRKKRSSY